VQNTIITSARYDTWNTFRKEVEKRLGHYLNNNLWLQAKPKKALPWFDSDLDESIVYVRKTEQRNT
jgi:hypothetical protein